MKIEKISENQIKCILTSEDLDARNIRLSDLAYGSAQTRKLFREMMHEADLEVGFRTQGAPLMVEAIPTSSDSIMLIITRVDDPDELDARFSRFTRPKNDVSDDADNQSDYELAEDPVPFRPENPVKDSAQSDDKDDDTDMQGLEELFHRLFEALGRKEENSRGADSITPDSSPQADTAAETDGTDSTENSSAAGRASGSDTGSTVSGKDGHVSGSDDIISTLPGHSDNSSASRTPDKQGKGAGADGTKQAGGTPAAACGFEFPTLDSVIEAAHSPAGTYRGRSILYRRPDRHGTYLLIVHGNSSSSEYASVCGILSEYGHPLRISPAREAWFAEHSDTLIRTGALTKLMNV